MYLLKYSWHCFSGTIETDIFGGIEKQRVTSYYRVQVSGNFKIPRSKGPPIRDSKSPFCINIRFGSVVISRIRGRAANTQLRTVYFMYRVQKPQVRSLSYAFFFSAWDKSKLRILAQWRRWQTDFIHKIFFANPFDPVHSSHIPPSFEFYLKFYMLTARMMRLWFAIETENPKIHTYDRIFNMETLLKKKSWTKNPNFVLHVIKFKSKTRKKNEVFDSYLCHSWTCSCWGTSTQYFFIFTFRFARHRSVVVRILSFLSLPKFFSFNENIQQSTM